MIKSKIKNKVTLRHSQWRRGHEASVRASRHARQTSSQSANERGSSHLNTLMAVSTGSCSSPSEDDVAHIVLLTCLCVTYICRSLEDGSWWLPGLGWRRRTTPDALHTRRILHCVKPCRSSSFPLLDGHFGWLFRPFGFLGL